MTPDADQFAAFLITRDMADNTVRTYRALYQRWLDWCVTHGADPWKVDPIDLRRWARTLHGSRSIMAQARGMVANVCRMMDLDERQLAIPVPRAPRRPTRALDPDEAEKLEKVAHEAGVAGSAVLVGLYTAARRAEIAGMEWSRIGDGRITFWRVKVRDWHTIPLHPVLQRHLELRRTDEQWVFPGRHGGHISPAQVWKWVRDVADQAGIGKVTPHQLRSTALTMANDATRDLRAVMDFAGHTSPAVTAGYTRVNQTRLEQTIRALDYGGGR